MIAAAPSAENVQRFFPVPAVFNATPQPSYGPLTQTSGPVDPNALTAVAPPGSCKTMYEVLASIPETSMWLQTLKNVGLDVILLNLTNLHVTLLAPINSAFQAGINDMPARPEKTMAALIANAPDIINPLAGYAVVQGLWPSSTLQPGTLLPTSDTIDKVNPLNITVASPTVLQGIGSSANILQKDLAACGPSVVHVIDQFLLPFKFDQAPQDAITATQAPVYTSSAG